MLQRSHNCDLVHMQPHWNDLCTLSALPVLLVVRPTAASAYVEVVARAEANLRVEATSPILPTTVSTFISRQVVANCIT